MEATDLARRSEPGTLIRGRFHLYGVGYGERREIGRFVKVDFWKARLAERFDPEGHKNPWRGAEVSGHSRTSDRSAFGKSPMDIE